jgi:hypothetical protein
MRYSLSPGNVADLPAERGLDTCHDMHRVHNLLNQERHLITTQLDKQRRSTAFAERQALADSLQEGGRLVVSAALVTLKTLF